MDEEFAQLEKLIENVVRLVEELRAENGRLKEENAQLLSQKDEVLRRINFVVDKLATLS